MSAPTWKNVREAFDAVLDLAPAARDAYLEQELDVEVAAQVRSLLEHHEAATHFLAPVPKTLLADGMEASAQAPIERADLEGTTLAGRYELGARLGMGGTASVYEAVDGLSGDTVAVKVGEAGPAAPLDLIRHEALALRLLRLPGVVHLLDTGRDGERSFLVMNRVHGRPFPGLKGDEPVTWDRIRRRTLALLETLARVHWTGVAHCDLKPSNVLVEEDGTPVVLDLGIAQDPGGDEALRRMLALAGTPRYRAPEQLRGDPGGARSDLYAVGVMLYEALAGVDPHGARDAAELLSFRPHAPARPLADAAPEVPAAVAALVDRMIAADPIDRPSSAAAAVRGFREAEADRAGSTDRLARLGPPNAATYTVAELIPLFAGLERIHRIPGDGAQALRARTGGEPDQVRDELAAWERAGIARWEDGHVHIARAALDRLRSGQRVRAEAAPGTEDLPAELRDLWTVVDLLGTHATVDRVADVLELTPEAARRGVDALGERALVVAGEDGRVRAERPSDGGGAWPAARRGALHARLAEALPADEPLRLYHRIMSGRTEEVAREAGTVAGALLAAGRVGEASAALSEGLAALRAEGAAAGEATPLLGLLLRLAMQTGTPGAMDRVLYTVGRHPGDDGGVRAIERIARAAQLALQRDTTRALEELPALDDDLGGEAARTAVSTKLFLSRHLDADEAEAIVAEAQAFADRREDPVLARSIGSERAWQAYARGDYAAAAAGHHALAGRSTMRASRTASLINAASAALEASAFDDAVRWAEEAVAEAEAGRHVHAAARAERVLRAAAYRRGDALEPDDELLEAIAAIGSPPLDALVSLNEAAVAWRAGMGDRARALAARAEARWRRVGDPDGMWFCVALGVALGRSTTADEFAQMRAALEACADDGVVAQAAHLAASVDSPEREAFRALAKARAAKVPAALHHARREVLAITEITG